MGGHVLDAKLLLLEVLTLFILQSKCGVSTNTSSSFHSELSLYKGHILATLYIIYVQCIHSS